MGTFGKCNGGGRRSAARSAAPLIVVFTTRTQHHSAELADVSSSGARLRGADLPPMGEDLVLAIDEGIKAFGKVVWCDHGECGIEFDEPISAASESLLRQKVCLARGLPPDMKVAFDNWVLGCGR